jgi:hypothetical protein
MTTLSLLALLFGAGLLVLAHRMGGDVRAHDVIIGTLSPVSITRAACACLLAFGGTGILVTLAIPAADSAAARLASALGLGAAVVVLVISPRPGSAVPRVAGQNASVSPVAVDNDAIVGMTGTFVAARGARTAGRVVVRRGERTIEIAARPVIDAQPTQGGDAVVIVDVYQGTALVAPVVRDGAPA